MPKVPKISLHILAISQKKKWGTKLIFRQLIFLQVDIIILISCLQIDIKGFFILILAFWVCVTRHAQITQNNKLLFLCNIFRKKWVEKLIFCMQISMKVSYNLISTLSSSKFPTRWYCHYWWAWSSILKVLKVTCLQYVCNISKKKLGMEFIFCI